MKNYSDELDFISIIIPAYNRFYYLEEIIQSIHDTADMPFEIIIHDDNSSDGTREKILSKLKDKVSTVILNNGLQLGLSESINRCVKIAGSNYIVMLNADCKIEYPIFKDVINILKCPFVGNISLMTVSDINISLNNNDTNFQLVRGLGAGCAQAFTKDVFEKIGGWYSHKVASGNSDVSFIIRILKNGYFITSFTNQLPAIRNLSLDREENKDSTISRGYYDCSYPKIFNLHKSKYLKLFDIHKTKRPILDAKVGDDIYATLSRKRYEDASNQMQITYKEEAGETNMDYWHKLMEKIVKEDYTLNIDEAKKYGHDKWINEINKYKETL